MPEITQGSYTGQMEDFIALRVFLKRPTQFHTS